MTANQDAQAKESAIITDRLRTDLMNYRTNSEIKSISRDKMLGKYGTAIGAFLLMRSICFSLMNACSFFANPDGLIYAIIIFILSLIEGIFVYGEQKIYMQMSCGYETRIMEVFSGFRRDADRAIFATFLSNLILYGAFLLGAGIFYLPVGRTSQFYVIAVIWCVLVAVAGIALLLNYPLVMLIMHDFPEMKVIDAFRRSRELMKGRKMSFLWMVISFIPLHILGALTFFVGEIFIHPYYKMAVTEFYFDIVKPKETVTAADPEQASTIDVQV